jgi:hypothetical protein
LAQRRSRKHRKERRRRAAAEPRPEPPSGAGSVSRGYARGREKDEAARAALKPLPEGERPLAVTIAAVVALFLGLANLISYAAGLEVRGSRPAVPGVVVYSGLLLTAAYGMWRVRYWAVLGMEAILGIVMLIFSVLVLTASNVLTVAISIAVIVPAGALFWFLIRAMARIQMEERRPLDD